MTEELGPRAAAERLGATTRTVQRWIATGQLPGRRVGGRWRVAIDALDAFVAREPVEPPRAAPIRTVFVANRGEIAARITRTCDRLGVRAVVPITEGRGAVDLLAIDAVVAAAAASGADAVHPGFGFLAENAAFAEAVLAAGLRWVGPPPAAIRTMGDKSAARRLANELGVPIVPGYDRIAAANQSDAALRRAAKRIGLPLLIKPAAGGGGKGMRIVRTLDGFADALVGARREALAAFADDRLILERLIEGPRHVEVQLLFDARGNGVHLGERDCSIQRRHQKVLEESPSPAVNVKTRKQLTDWSLAIGRAVGYVGAGTCEFLLGDGGDAYFLEMNARLQVEHPVTEAVTWRDLVADQLRIAAGEPLGFGQGEVASRGHAIEVRLYAEDAESGFLPATGRIEALEWPAGEGIRVDAGVGLRTEVGGRFDPMLAKIIAHGPDRPEALARLAGALDRTVLLGLTTNLRFLRWLVRQPLVMAGQARIDSLEQTWPPADWAAQSAIPDSAWEAAARALGAGGWRLNAPPTVRLSAEGIEHPTAVHRDGPPEADRHDPRVAVAGQVAHVDVGGRSVAITAAAPPDVDRAARAAAAHAHAGGPSEITAPMPGAVVAVHVALGDTVEPGDPLLTLEAMKMEHVVAATDPGRVSEIHVRAGAQVTRGQLVVVVEA
jgi:excisionase family DNA binding protein